jgi:hypothetical protein
MMNSLPGLFRFGGGAAWFAGGPKLSSSTPPQHSIFLILLGIALQIQQITKQSSSNVSLINVSSSFVFPI